MHCGHSGKPESRAHPHLKGLQPADSICRVLPVNLLCRITHRFIKGRVTVLGGVLAILGPEDIEKLEGIIIVGYPRIAHDVKITGA